MSDVRSRLDGGTVSTAPGMNPAKIPLHERVEAELSLQPVHPSVVPALEQLRAHAKTFAHAIVELCPSSREQSLALTEVDSALRWAIAAIVRA